MLKMGHSSRKKFLQDYQADSYSYRFIKIMHAMLIYHISKASWELSFATLDLDHFCFLSSAVAIDDDIALVSWLSDFLCQSSSRH